MLSNPPILALVAAAFLTPPCLAADVYTGVFERLSRIEPLPRLSPELKIRVIASLPKEGEVRVLTVKQRLKLESVMPVLTAHGRDADYLVKVVESPEARLAIHARFVVLVTETALRILTPAQLQALVAHEIGHEYVWDEYLEAQNRNDWSRLRELELFCDGVAILTLARIGISMSTLIDALRTMDGFNRISGRTNSPFENRYPSLFERARFGKAVAKWLAASVNPC